ncbi:Dbl homology domain-containing protein [Sporodiniella umbellata]|nr:Dbl homology domain-containing protein [Sporodiniella umbellata]
MHSVVSEKNKAVSLKEGVRPILTNTKKRWSGLLSKNKHNTSPVAPSEDLVESPDSDKTIFPPVNPKSAHRRANSNGCNFKKRFHLPSFGKQDITADGYTPEIPEPIMPPLIDWSPETPLSPIPWELQTTSNPPKKRHALDASKRYSFNSFHDDSESVDTEEEDLDYHSDPELNEMDIHEISSDVTLISTGSSHLRRRSSCPDYDSLSQSSTSTVVEKDILWITDQSARHMSAFKNHKHAAERKATFKPCQKTLARAAEAAANGDTTPRHTPLLMHFCEETAKYLYIPNIVDPVSHKPVLKFTNIKPRQYELKRKTSWKREAKGLRVWHDTLKDILQSPSPTISREKYHDKMEKHMLTRNFILREFYVTEVNFWNQLYYTKVVFYDALTYAMDKHSNLNTNVADSFSNLFDLMKFSAKMIHRLRHFQLNQKALHTTSLKDMPTDCNIQLGKVLCEASEDLVVFFRCALDYRENKKLLQHKMYESYRERLYTRKETSKFTMEDYFIIPIQRVARYGLLLADLLKHSDPDMDDYKHLVQAHKVITSLATAMDSIQKK